jgi:exopolyphosphatase/guanosine-5'-triphosphate,3'-diphosphate pyrophosphatase
MTADGKRVVAFLDIGTNSVRMLLVRLEPAHGYTVLTYQKEAVRLGEGEFQAEHLQPEAIDRTVLVCRKFVDLAQSRGADEFVAAATSATREAHNREALLRRLETEAGLHVHVVSGREEARLVYLGIVSGLNLGEKRALIIDVGGGSTELIVGEQKQFILLDSVRLGAIRLSGEFFRDRDRPVSSARYDAMCKAIRSAAAANVRRVKQFAVDMAVGSSGTATNLADVAAREYLKRKWQRDDVFTYEQVRGVIDKLCALPLEERRKVPGLNPERADIIIAGAAIFDVLMKELGLKEITVSERGLRDGLLMDYLSRTDGGVEISELPLRLRSVLKLGHVCGFDEAHARQVAGLALELFDGAKAVGLHRFGGTERELLEYAALLHDIGMFLSYESHHRHSYYLIRHSDLLGFDQNELAIMATTALFHRRYLPRRRYPEFAALDNHGQKIVRVLSTLLRLAESLDRSHAGLVRHARLTGNSSGPLRLLIECSGECQLELWGVNGHQAAFKSVFGRIFEVESVPVQAMMPTR